MTKGFAQPETTHQSRSTATGFNRFQPTPEQGSVQALVLTRFFTAQAINR